MLCICLSAARLRLRHQSNPTAVRPKSAARNVCVPSPSAVNWRLPRAEYPHPLSPIPSDPRMTLRLCRLMPAVLPLALAFALPRTAAAQVDTVAVVADSLYTIRLSDGSVLYGRVTEQSADGLTVETQSGATVRLRRDQVVSMERLAGRVVNGQVWGD